MSNSKQTPRISFKKEMATLSRWDNVAVLRRDKVDRYLEAKPYVRALSGGDSTDVRFAEALDPTFTATLGDPNDDDAPTGSIVDGDGWRKIDEITGLADGNEWPVMGAGYETDSHLLLLQATRNTGEEIIRVNLKATPLYA